MSNSDLKDLAELPSLRRFQPGTERALGREERFTSNLTVDDQGEAWLHRNVTAPSGQREAFAVFDGRHGTYMGHREQLLTAVQVQAGDEEIILRGHASPITGIAFSVDSRAVVTACEGGKVIIHGLPMDGRLAEHILDAPSYAVSPALSAADGVLAALLLDRGSNRTRKRVRIWYPVSGDPVDLTSRRDSPRCLAVSPDGGCLALGHESGLLELWSVAGILGQPTLRKRVKLKQYEGCIVGLAFSPGGRALGLLTSQRQLISWVQG